ncbi:hypothetical protein K1X76_01345 [bacterium]|nr:hypothetical protein [bacterium]
MEESLKILIICLSAFWILYAPILAFILYRKKIFNRWSLLAGVVSLFLLVSKLFLVFPKRSSHLLILALDDVLWPCVLVIDMCFVFCLIAGWFRVDKLKKLLRGLVFSSLVIFVLINAALIFLMISFNDSLFLGHWKRYRYPRFAIETKDTQWIVSVHNIGEPFGFGSQVIHVYYRANRFLAWPHFLINTTISDDGRLGHVAGKWVGDYRYVLAFSGEEQSVIIWEIDVTGTPVAKQIFESACGYKTRENVDCILSCDGSSANLEACYSEITKIE